MGSVKVKLDKDVYDRAEAAAERLGYESVEEFITHLLERELARGGDAEDEEELKAKLKGLGYIE